MFRIYNQNVRKQFLIFFLKPCGKADCFDSDDRLFHGFAPQKEEYLWPFADPFIGNLRPVTVLRRLFDEQSENRMKRSTKYCAASSFGDLKTIDA